MQLFNVSSDGGPGHMFTNVFMQFLNQTSAIFAPFFGISGGDPLALFNGVIQQFLSVFAQITGLWSNTVSRQMDMWSSNVAPKDALEFDLVNRSIIEMNRIQNNVELLALHATKGNEQAFKETFAQTRGLMDRLWACFDPDVHGPEVVMRQVRRTGQRRRMRPEEYQRQMMVLQEEIVSLWRMISDRIMHNLKNPDVPHVYGPCYQGSPINTPESTPESSTKSSGTSPSESSNRRGRGQGEGVTSSSSSTSTTESLIEFEDDDDDK